jgi:hypothetical protein
VSQRPPHVLPYATPGAVRPRRRRWVPTNPLVRFWRRHAVLIGGAWTLAIPASYGLSEVFALPDERFAHHTKWIDVGLLLMFGWPVYVIVTGILCWEFARPPARRRQA